jgi:hypothetical protein
MPTYDPVGRCIYCEATTPTDGADRFSDEHIIPLGLGGNLVLPEASCAKCQKTINKQIETPILRHEWGGLRDKRGFPTRNKKDRVGRTHVPVTGVDGSEILIPLHDHSTPVPLYRFDEPRVLSMKSLPTLDHHWTMSILSSREESQAMHEKFPKWNKQHRLRARPHLFARMLAKIAHGYAIAEYGLSKLGTFAPLAPGVIRGISGDWTQIVGGTMEIPPPVPGGNHITNLMIVPATADCAYLICEVRLFSQNSTPLYRVVVGRIDFKNPTHVRALEKHRLDGKIES